jgi:hypothetical protein
MTNYTASNPIAELVRTIIREELEAMLGNASVPAADPDPEPIVPARAHRVLPANYAAPSVVEPRETRNAAPRRAPVRTATPAHYRPTKFAQSAAGQKMIAQLTPRLANTFKAIARRKTGMSRPDVSSATDTTPKQAENNVYGLQKLELVETFYPNEAGR